MLPVQNPLLDDTDDDNDDDEDEDCNGFSIDEEDNEETNNGVDPTNFIETVRILLLPLFTVVLKLC